MLNLGASSAAPHPSGPSEPSASSTAPKPVAVALSDRWAEELLPTSINGIGDAPLNEVSFQKQRNGWIRIP